MSDNRLTDENVSEIDRALNAAKARKAAKDASSAAPRAPRAARAAAEPKAPRKPRVTDEEKAARATARAALLASNRAARTAARLAKKAEVGANKPPAHLKKVAKAAARLTPLSQAAQLLFGEATASLSAVELSNLAIHINQHNRAQATVRALSTRLEPGMAVTIVGGDPRFVGKPGTIVKCQRIRCEVALEGVKRAIYMFTSDVSPVSTGSASATA